MAAAEKTESKNYFTDLNGVDVSKKVEKKNGLSYLSWAWAWAELKKRYPDSTYTIYENENGLFYHTDGRTAWVKTGVTVNGIEHIEYLPVMDYRNNSIPLDKLTSFDVNKAIQRSLTKAVARHGLGLYIYAGEDLPEEATAEAVEAEKPKKTTTKKKATTTTTAAASAEGLTPRQKLVAWCKAMNFNIRDVATRYKLNNSSSDDDFYDALDDLIMIYGGSEYV